MEINPIPPSLPPGAVNSNQANDPDAENAAQAAFYLGYLEMLASQPVVGKAELDRIIALYEGPNGFLNTVSSTKYPEISGIIQRAMAQIAPGGSWTTGSLAAFSSWYGQTSKDDPNPPVLEIWSWFAPADGGTPGYSFSGNSSDDTSFAFTMFLVSGRSTELSSLGLDGDIEQFMGRNSMAGRAYSVNAEFLEGYAYLHGYIGTVIASILPASDPNTNYDKFVTQFSNDYGNWSNEIPAGMTPEQAEQAWAQDLKKFEE
jgi:hypothetical protein